MPQSKYLVVDDYGTGGIWFIVLADSQEQIADALPTVTVYDPGVKPEWMSDEKLAEIGAKRTYSIDELPTSDWMNNLRQAR
jgi:hypothetical protein